MSFDPNDPRLTAYALGELDESEIAAIEAQLVECSESRSVVDEVRATARLLTEQLTRETGPGLDPKQLVALDGELAKSSPAAIPFSKRPVFRFLQLGLAASLMGAVGLAYYASRQPENAPLAVVAWRNAAPAAPKAAAGPVAEFAETRDQRAAADSAFSRGLETKSELAAGGDLKVAAEASASGVGGGRKDLDRPGVMPAPSEAAESLDRVGAARGLASRPAQKPASAPAPPGPSGLARSEPGLRFAGEPASAPMMAPQLNANQTQLNQQMLYAPAAAAPAGAVASKRKAPAADAPKPPADKPVDLEENHIRAFQAVDVSGIIPRENAEIYKPVVDNPFLRTVEEANRLSTFSIDVDTASYSNVRRILNEGRMPPPGAARIEEMINYFPYDYPQPQGDAPFSITAEIARCPWNGEHRLARIGLKGRSIDSDRRPASNLVFLIDVSGSMAQENKLPLVKEGLRLLVDKLGGEDRVAIVVYASRTAVELPSTELARRAEILAAIDRLNPGGSTNGEAGINLAYEEATKHFIPQGTNRVILCTDGDFNVGIADEGDLVRLIEAKARESKVFLSVLGFGVGNLKDSKMKALADHGNGNYAYIDTKDEARKVLVDQMSATLVTIAKDVKIQVEFNPARVGAYRLLGYENRLLRAEDFNNDAKDAGEIGAGHTITALYELIPPGKEGDLPGVDKLKYSKQNAPIGDPESKELMTVKLRFKAPEGDESKKIEVPVIDGGREYPEPADDFKFAAAVAEFGMILRHSPYKGNATLAAVHELAESARGSDPWGYRAGFVDLVGQAERLAKPVMRAVK